ncbi:putative Glutamate receptor [Hibiscus syriacus]|uniref:Glutamate receptor n=1 Tax=Hibiscus syriacus TaxID=106335 RepID=A0A6A2XER3_HIBSY|nr:putative Glutamate receptor [Hibiscus syriacus]
MTEKCFNWGVLLKEVFLQVPQLCARGLTSCVGWVYGSGEPTHYVMLRWSHPKYFSELKARCPLPPEISVKRIVPVQLSSSAREFFRCCLQSTIYVIRRHVIVFCFILGRSGGPNITLQIGSSYPHQREGLQFLGVIWDSNSITEKSVRGYEQRNMMLWSDFGDVTLVANRSLYVDFTSPYTESGVSMLVPMKDNKKKNAWVFLQPLTSDLWITSGCFFVSIGFVVWILEHRMNDDFRFNLHIKSAPASGSPPQPWWEKVVSNLISGETPAHCTDLNVLLKRRVSVGFLYGSFVKGMLLGLKFDKSQLKTYTTPEELHNLFKGSSNGGISAAINEIPCIKLFIAKHCRKYTAVEPTFKTGGFGFLSSLPRFSSIPYDTLYNSLLFILQVFAKGSPLVARYFNGNLECYSSLGLESFWGLFLIAGLESISALVIFAAMFLYEQRHVLFELPSEASIWRRVRFMSRIFDEKDMSSHTFKKTEPPEMQAHQTLTAPQVHQARRTRQILPTLFLL